MNEPRSAWRKRLRAIMIGAQVPVIVLAAPMTMGGWFGPLVVLAIGVPIASLVAFLVIQPVVNALLEAGRLRLRHALLIGALMCALPSFVLKLGTILRTILHTPAETGLMRSSSYGVIVIENGMYTRAGWLFGVVAPAAVFATLGMLGALVAWRLAFGSLASSPPQ